MEITAANCHYSIRNAFKDEWVNYFTVERQFGCDEFDNVLASFSWKSDVVQLLCDVDKKHSRGVIRLSDYNSRDSSAELSRRLYVVNSIQNSSSFDINRFLSIIHERELHHIRDFDEIIKVLFTLIGSKAFDGRLLLIRKSIVDYWSSTKPFAVEFRRNIWQQNLYDNDVDK